MLPHCSSCPDQLAEFHVREAAIDFCQRTKAWQAELNPVSLSALVDEYDLDNPTQGAIVEVQRVLIKRSPTDQGIPLEVKLPDELDRIYPGWQDRRGEVLGYHMLTRRRMRVVLTPDKAVQNAIVAIAASRPSRSATALDSSLYDEYAKEIAVGALANLFGLADKTWTSATKAAARNKDFDDAISRVNVEQAQSFSRAPLHVTAVYSIS